MNKININNRINNTTPTPKPTPTPKQHKKLLLQHASTTRHPCPVSPSCHANSKQPARSNLAFLHLETGVRNSESTTVSPMRWGRPVRRRRHHHLPEGSEASPSAALCEGQSFYPKSVPAAKRRSGSFRLDSCQSLRAWALLETVQRRVVTITGQKGKVW